MGSSPETELEVREWTRNVPQRHRVTEERQENRHRWKADEIQIRQGPGSSSVFHRSSSVAFFSVPLCLCVSVAHVVSSFKIFIKGFQKYGRKVAKDAKKSKLF